MLVQNRTVVLKFFLHISKAEQRERLEARLHDPTRYWKFSLKDVEERRYWSAYRKAYEEALTRCSTKWAPWHIIPADHKWYRNVAVAKILVEALRGLVAASHRTINPGSRPRPGRLPTPAASVRPSGAKASA